MKNKIYILLLILTLSGITLVPRAYGASSKEYKVKAALIYNFIKFIDWPDEELSGDSNSITIGIVGGGDFIEAFDPIKSKQVKGKNIIIKLFEEVDKPNEHRKKKNSKWEKKISAMKKCQVLFICSYADEKSEIPVEILNALEGSGVLVIGETSGFLESGGAINFIMEGKKVRFEINAKAAEDNGLKIRSQLLKLAKRVITKEEPKNRKS
jgi:hypothetical protein